MIFEDVVGNGIVNATGEVATEAVVELGKIGKWLEAIGLVVIIWLVFQVIVLIVNRKNRKRIYRMEQGLHRIEGKLDKVLSKKK
jgi:hypothetical protein